MVKGHAVLRNFIRVPSSDLSILRRRATDTTPLLDRQIRIFFFLALIERETRGWTESNRTRVSSASSFFEFLHLPPNTKRSSLKEKGGEAPHSDQNQESGSQADKFWSVQIQITKNRQVCWCLGGGKRDARYHKDPFVEVYFLSFI